MPLNAFAIIDSTLREGEQFYRAAFNLDHKLELARCLDEFGTDYLEVTSPLASPRSAADCEKLAKLGLRAKILTHTRCNLIDARRAVEAGVQGVNVVIGASPILLRFSLQNDIDSILEMALEVVAYLRRFQIEVRFSTEDSLRSEPATLYAIYQAVDRLNPHRLGVADTVGIGTPRQIFKLIAGLRKRVRADIEFHGHNDTGCAVANALAALEAGATHIDTCILGIGERNGITPLSSLIARLHSLSPNYTAAYKLPLLKTLDRRLGEILGLEIPFNQPITGEAAFRHNAGIHAKAVLNHPQTYEALSPADFGLDREVLIGHKLMGWHTLRHRAQKLGLTMEKALLKSLTLKIKAMADAEPVPLHRIDEMLFQAKAGQLQKQGKCTVGGPS